MKTRTRITDINHLHNWSAARVIAWVVAWSAALAMPGLAATNFVTSTDDNGPGSLRQMIADATAGDTLMFDVMGTITLTSGELVLVKNLNIIGPGAANLAISGNHVSRLLTVQSNVVASLSGLTLRDGKASNGDAGTVVEGHATPGGPGQPGGAIYTVGTLTLNDCRVISNAAGHGGYGIGNDVLMVVSAGGNGGSGGGVYSAGTMYVNNCVVSGNSAGNGGNSGGGWTFSPISGAGGGGGGIYNVGALWLDNSVVSSNVAGSGGDTPREARVGHGGAGGGIWNSGVFTALGSTVYGNASGNGGRGGVDSLDGGDGGSGGNGGGVFSSGGLALTNCTVSGNFCGRGGDGGLGVLGDSGTGGNGGSGGGIYIVGTNIVLVNCGVFGNRPGQGGGDPGPFGWSGSVGPYESSQALVTSCTEAALRAALAGPQPVTFACEGTIMLSSTITITNDTVLDGGGHQVTISGNEAVRVFRVSTNVNFTLLNLTVSAGRSTYGGAVCNDAGTVNLTNCVLSDNIAAGAAGMDGRGGAIHSVGNLNISRCSFLQNTASGGQGPDAEWGTWEGPGAPGGSGLGGAIFNLGTLVVERSLLASNSASGGSGGRGADAVWLGSGVPPNGGAGGAGGQGYGGAVFAGGPASMINNTVVWNQASGGNGGNGGSGTSYHIPHGGGVAYTSDAPGGNGGDAVAAIHDEASYLRLTNCTVASSFSHPGVGGSVNGIPGANGQAWGGIETQGGVLKNTLLANNIPTNSTGFITDAGHNLSADASCAFTNTGSLNNTDPKLGPLANNGGPTLTMALLPGSHAIDAGDTATAPAVDQRGVPRPYGQAADIGAFEYWLSAQAMHSPSGGVDIVAWGIAGQSCCLLVSPDLTTWTATATNQIGVDGTVLFHDEAIGPSSRFYRFMLQ